MKILAINGSPHRNQGATGFLINKVLEEIRGSDVETEIILLCNLRINPCLACEQCHIVGECPQKDDLSIVMEKMLKSDGIILASPVYLMQVTGQMKILMDRLHPMVHCLHLEGKYGAVISVSGGFGEEDVAKYLNFFLRWTGAQTVGMLSARSYNGSQFLKLQIKFLDENKVLTNATTLGQELIQAIREKREYPEQKSETAFFREEAKNLLRDLKKDIWPFEYEYFKKKGWL